MNVAIFASAFYPHIGGVEELVRQLAREFKRRGISTVILTNRWPRSLSRYELYEGVPVYRLAMRTPWPGFKARFTHLLTHALIRRQMIGILRKHEIELLHVQCVSGNGYYALAASRALGLPLVVTTQGERTMDATQLFQRSEFMRRTLRELMGEADYVTACSKDTLRDMEAFYGQPFGDRAEVIYNGIDASEFDGNIRHQHARPYILGIGRLVPQKGFDVLIKAFAKAQIESHELLIAGEGPERSALEELSRTLGVKQRVHFVGRADRAKVVALFNGCSFFVLPSRLEPLGIVNLEAMAAGKAVIASDVGGVPEIVRDGETGMLIPCEDISALGNAMRRMASDEEMRQRMGAAGRVQAESFCWPRIADSYEWIYRNLLSRPLASNKSEVPEPAF